MNKKVLIGCGSVLVVMIVAGVMSARMLLKIKPEAARSETVTTGTVEIKVVETGTIEPLRKVEVKSKVGGRISKLFVDAGAPVQQRQILATIDPQEINSQVAALQAQLAGGRARLAAAKKNATFQADTTTSGISQYVQAVEAARARLKQAEAESGVQQEMTNQNIDVAKAALESAKAQHKAMQDNLNLMVQSTHPQAVVNAQTAYDQAKAQADNSHKSLLRQQKLLSQGFVSQQVVDVAQTDYEVAVAHVREVKERLDRIKQTNALEEANMNSQVAGAQSQVRQMQVSLEQAKVSVAPTMKLRELDSARAAYEQAKSQLATARAGKTQDKIRLDDVAAAEAEVRQIQNQLNVQLVSQGDTTLIAPMSGVITKRYVEQGELITSAIGSFSSGSPVFQLSDLATMLVKINVNEVDIAKVKSALLTEVTIDAAKGVTFLGKVSKVAPAAADAATAGSGGGGGGGGGGQSVIRFPVEIRVDQADLRLKPGMSAHCSIIVARKKDVLRVPANCVQGTGPKGTVQVVTTTTKDGQPVETATPRDVIVGLRAEDFVEIVSGLKAGEKVRPGAYTGPPRKTIDFKGGPD